MHIVWDWNGTLLNDMELVVAATNASLAAFGGPTVTAEEHRRDFRRPVWAYYEAVLGRRLSPDEFARLDAAFHAAYRAGLASCALSKGAEEVLRAWSGTQSLLSMWFHDQLVPTVTGYGLTPYFARVDGLRQALGGGHKAPHLAEHLAALGVPGSDCVVIGDSVDDADAAASVGARVILYSGGFTDPRRLRSTGQPVVDTLADAIAMLAVDELARHPSR